MKKNALCVGCPMFQSGDGFVPDELQSQAKVDVWLQNPGDAEERKAQPAVGATGDYLNEDLLPAAGLSRGVDVNVRNVLRCRWENTNNLPPAEILKKAVAHCRIHDAATNPEVSVACGSLAWRMMFDGPGTITEWRGFMHPSRHVIATLHPADTFRDPKMRLPLQLDFGRVRRYLAKDWPKETPIFTVVRNATPPSLAINLISAWFQSARAAKFTVIDTEYVPETKWLTTIGLGYPEGEGLQVWTDGLDPVVRSHFKRCLKEHVGVCTTVFQNAMADIPVLEQAFGLAYKDYRNIEDTMLAHAVLWSDWPHTLEYIASIYGQYRKMKHLSKTNPELYNWGDVLDTICGWQSLAVELNRDGRTKLVYETQSKPLVPIILRRVRRGIRVDRAMVGEEQRRQLSIIRESQGIALAAAGWPINPGSDDQLKEYLYDAGRYPVQLDKNKKVSTGADAISTLRSSIEPQPDLDWESREGLSLDIALERIAGGADPILESRVLYAAASQTLTHFLKPMVDVDRVFPSIKIHAQASGRWSITEPPIQQFPWEIQQLLIPDAGEAWLGWDWDQAELRILAALSNDEVYLRAFTLGHDVHTINSCDIFGLGKPPYLEDPHTDPRNEGWRQGINWQGKDDVRRFFAKRFVYRLNYGGDARTAGDIPGAKKLGLTSKTLQDASNNYLNAHPRLRAWRMETEAEAKRTRESHTFMGRRRRLLGEGRAAIREAYDHPMQGGVSDILNTCIIEIEDRCRGMGSGLVYSTHDAGWVAVCLAELVNAKSIIYDIINQPWDIGGVKTVIPAKFKPIRYAPEDSSAQWI
jgi:uracil-DNA glycosylase family 4